MDEMAMAEAEAKKTPTSNVLVLSKRVEKFIWKQYDFPQPMRFVRAILKPDMYKFFYCMEFHSVSVFSWKLGGEL